jgi:hypothetical protein
LPRGRQLVTLEDAGAYIMKLPKAEQRLEEWQAATEAVIMAAEPLMHAHVGMMAGPTWRQANSRIQSIEGIGDDE